MQDLPLFGASPAEIVEVDGDLLVRSPPETRLPAEQRATSEKKTAALEEQVTVTYPKSEVTTDVGMVVSHSIHPQITITNTTPLDQAEMHRRLELMREVERLTVYRLVIRVAADGARRLTLEAPKIE